MEIIYVIGVIALIVIFLLIAFINSGTTEGPSVGTFIAGCVIVSVVSVGACNMVWKDDLISSGYAEYAVDENKDKHWTLIPIERLNPKAQIPVVAGKWIWEPSNDTTKRTEYQCYPVNVN